VADGWLWWLTRCFGLCAVTCCCVVKVTDEADIGGAWVTDEADIGGAWVGWVAEGGRGPQGARLGGRVVLRDGVG
jgi:hypothetical protein